jgi:hypothetical protein
LEGRLAQCGTRPALEIAAFLGGTNIAVGTSTAASEVRIGESQR